MKNEHGEVYVAGAELSEFKHEFDGRCWWCGAEKVTSEHKFKRSDLKALGDDALLWTDGVEWQQLRSSGDRRARHNQKNLCSRCNNERSQPADRAWQALSEYTFENWVTMGGRDTLDLGELYGDHPLELSRQALELQQYVVRQLGCRISNDGFRVPDDIRSYLDSGANNGSLGICLFYSHERAALMDRQAPITMLSIGPLIATISKSKRIPTALVTEICVGPVGALVKWSSDEPVGGTIASRFANVYSRAGLPYLEIHQPWPILESDPGPE
ncbi:hypothetical protein [Nocardia sp. 348MFTsu5.1]|uniref:hypothetical protein n=1 Tax=Nocardia sp. 348MFTsu5.1 TaxID=1172185 RepID=UPI0006887030|nr:hypothetical protein [Nocardia sp. 348MFTsu5.1]